jgi:porin
MKRFLKTALLHGLMLCVSALLSPLLAQGSSEAEQARDRSLTESSDELSNLVGELDEQRDTRGLFEFDPLGIVFDPLDEARIWVDKTFHLQMGFAYTTLYQAATSGSDHGPGSGGAGDVDLFGTWFFHNVGQNTGFLNEGSIGFNFEYRHELGGAPPSELGDSIGSLWGTTSGFNVQDFSLVQLWLQQRFFDEKFGIRFGKIDLASIFDVYRFNSSNHFYQNAAFSDNPAIPFPGNGLASVVGWYPTDEWFFHYGLGDAEGQRTETVNSRNAVAWFSAATVGWNGDVGDLGKGLYQVTAWHTDMRAESERPSSTGFSAVAQQEVGDTWVPFVRYTSSDDMAVDVEHLITAGAVLEGLGRIEKGQLCFAGGWGSPHDDRLREQWVGEIFYRLQLLPEFRLTPSLQVIVNPSRNFGDDVIGIFGLRGRFTF